MKQLPETENPLVLRTDFSDDAAWETICAAIRESSEVANLEFLSDIEYSMFTTAQLLQIALENYEHPLIVVADRTSMASPDNALLVADLEEEPGREFRAVPNTLFLIAANLSVANMDFSEFADAVGEDSIYRGFN